MSAPSFYFALVITLLTVLTPMNAHITDFPSSIPTQTELELAASVLKTVPVAMTVEEVAMFLGYLNNSSSYFEFGCGGSTIVAAAFGPKNLNITSVDSSKEWLEAVRVHGMCRARVDADLLTLKFVDIGPTGAWGHPTRSAEESNGAWYLYSQAITLAGGVFDLVLVDGRFRVACALNAFLVNPSGKVLMHDFFEPSHHNHYKAILAVAEVVERVGTMVQLRRKPDVRQEDLMKMYAAHINVPHRL